MKKINNPLKKRVPREIFGEWHKYAVIAIFLIVTIGFVSGLLVANNSMITSAEKLKKESYLEDGCFEFDKKLSESSIETLEAGEKADVKQYYLDKGYKEADKEVEKAVNEAIPGEIEKAVKAGLEQQFPDGYPDEVYDEAYKKAYDDFMNSKDYDKALEDAREEAYEEVEKTVNEEYDKAADKYDLNDPDYKAVPIKIYENFYKDTTEVQIKDGKEKKTDNRKIRVFMDRDDIDLYSIHEGEMPKADNEIAIDRMHADNVGIKVGDTIRVGGEDFKVTALVALVNYSTLYEKPTDSMFDAINFDVSIVTEEGFKRIDKNIHYNYAWIYKDKPADVIEEKAMSENVMSALIAQSIVEDSEIKNFIPNYGNLAIHFATNDMGGDKNMAGIMLYILITVLGFIFAITITNTISKESSVIGTLRASGYTRGELLVHYMTMPVFVTLISAIIGNILGYSVFKKVVINMYYNSYSLPTYETYWTSDAFIKTTIVPVVLMFLINLVVIARMLRLSPLRFLRHDLKMTKRKKAIRLPKWKFLSRFRARILLQNIPNYMVLLVGITFVMILMSMVVGFPNSLDAYQGQVTDLMFAKNQTILKSIEDEDGNLIETTTKSAEKFAMKDLQYESNEHNETVSVYGVESGSKYIKGIPDMAEGEVYISSTFADKYGFEVGDEVVLDEKYDSLDYRFKVAGIYDYAGSMTVFMPIDCYRSTFDEDDDFFSGYMSDDPIEGIDDKQIATTITEDDILKISRQLDHSMGSYMTYFGYVGVILAVVLIYLLTKIIIEKNENAISMVKILGYENKEISGLYMTSTTIVVILSCFVGMAAGFIVMKEFFRNYLMSMEGWFDFIITPLGFVKMFLFVFIAYLIVMVFDYRRIKRIPMDEALKNVE